MQINYWNVHFQSYVLKYVEELELSERGHKDITSFN